VEEAQANLADFLMAAGVECEPIPNNGTSLAPTAFARYAKRRGHPTPLNMGGRRAYTAARNPRTMPLFKRDDRGKTDIVPSGAK
jgi:uncharacterized protein with PIN domain